MSTGFEYGNLTSLIYFISFVLVTAPILISISWAIGHYSKNEEKSFWYSCVVPSLYGFLFLFLCILTSIESYHVGWFLWLF